MADKTQANEFDGHLYESGYRRVTRRETDRVVKRAGQRCKERGGIKTTRKGAVNAATIFFKYKFEMGYYQHNAFPFKAAMNCKSQGNAN